MKTAAASPMVIALPSMQSAAIHQGIGDVPMHAHKETELVLVLRGTVEALADGVLRQGKRGDLFIFPARTPHDQRSRGTWRTLCVLFTNTGRLIEERPRLLSLARESRLRGRMEELVFLHRSSVPSMVSDCLLLALLSEVGYLEDQWKTMAALPPPLAKAVSFFQRHMTEEVDGMELARNVGISYSRLGVLFRAHFGCAPIKYHRKLRMEFAKKLLLNPYASIDEIAAQAGFEDTNYFCRLFRKTYAVAPGKWRKEAMACFEPNRKG